MPAPTKPDVSNDELESMYNAPETEHPLGADESNAFPSTKQPITPPEEANPGTQETGAGQSEPGEGDDDPTEDTPQDSQMGGSSGKGGQEQSQTGGGGFNKRDNYGNAVGPAKGGEKKSIKQRAQQRADAWKEKRAKLKKGKELAKKAKQFKKNFDRASKAIQAARAATAATAAETAGTTLAVQLALELANQARQLLKEGVEKYVKSKIKDVNKAKKWIIFAMIALSFVLIFIVFPMAFTLMLFGGGPGEDEKNRLDALAAAAGANTLTITKTGPVSGSADQYLTYTIHAVSSVPTTNIKLVDKIPTNTQYNKRTIDTTAKAVFTPGTGIDPGTITWNTKDTSNPSDATYTIQVRVDHNVRNTRIINIVNGTSDESSTAVNCTGSACAFKFILGTYTFCQRYTGIFPPYHEGVDLCATANTPIKALETGVIVESYFDTGCGNIVKLHAKGRFFLHCHLIRPGRAVGAVQQGEIMGNVGHTGGNTSATDHLHLQVTPKTANQHAAGANPEVELANWPTL